MRNTDQFLADIRDLNLNYLILAQGMIRSDMDMAIYRLNISKDLATTLNNLSAPQMLKLASTHSLIASLRFEDPAIIDILTHDKKTKSTSNAHSSILLANQVIRDIC